VSGYRAALATNLGNAGPVRLRSLADPALRDRGHRRVRDLDRHRFFVSAATQGALLLVAGGIADRVGRRPAMLVGAATASVSMLTVAVSSTLPVYVLAMALFGAGAAFLSVAPAAAMGDAGVRHGGTVVAAFQMSADLGAVAGPLVAGWLADDFSFGAAFGVTAAVSPAAGSPHCCRPRPGTGPRRCRRSRRPAAPPDAGYVAAGWARTSGQRLVEARIVAFSHPGDIPVRPDDLRAGRASLERRRRRVRRAVELRPARHRPYAGVDRGLSPRDGPLRGIGRTSWVGEGNDPASTRR